jgi:hypothetical protein
MAHDGEEDDDDDETGTVDPQELNENSSLWKSLWSQGRGILNTNRHVDAEEEDDDLSEEDEEGGAPAGGKEKFEKEDGKSDEKDSIQRTEDRARRKSEIISLSRARKMKVLAHSPFRHLPTSPSFHSFWKAWLKMRRPDQKRNLGLKSSCQPSSRF